MIPFRLRQWLWYRRHALGRHGVHSPFVFDLIERGLRSGIEESIEARIRRYFQPAAVIALNAAAAQKLIAENKAATDTVLLITGIRAAPEALALWQALCSNPVVTMSIDLYDNGVLLFRNEFKVRQHFVLKRY